MDVVAAVQQLLRQVIERLTQLLQQVPPGTLQLTGILGLAAAVVGYYQLRGGDRSNQAHVRNANSTPVNSQAAHRTQASSSQAPAPSDARQQQPVAGEPLTHTQQQIYGRLRGKRTVTLSTLGVLLGQSTPDQLQEGADVADGIPDILRELCRVVDVYLITRVVDDVGQAAALGVLEALGITGTGQGQVKPHKVLFCSTPEGVVSMVRQIEPDLHVDGSSSTIADLTRFMPRLLHIGPEDLFPSQANVDHAGSLAAFFGL